jgi:hypothetical protein
MYKPWQHVRALLVAYGWCMCPSDCGLRYDVTGLFARFLPFTLHNREPCSRIPVRTLD